MASKSVGLLNIVFNFIIQTNVLKDNPVIVPTNAPFIPLYNISYMQDN